MPIDVGANYKISPTSQLWVKLGHGNTGPTSPEILVASSLAGSLNKFNLGLENSDYGLRHTFTLPSHRPRSPGVSKGQPGESHRLQDVRSGNPVRSFLPTNSPDEKFKTAPMSPVRQPIAKNLLLEGDVVYSIFTTLSPPLCDSATPNGQETDVDSATRDTVRWARTAWAAAGHGVSIRA